MSIKRYTMSWGKDKDDYIYVSPTESTNGNWVKFDDYAALHYERIHDLNQIGGLQEENARLKAEVDLWKLRSDNWQKLVQVTKAEVERLTDAITRGASTPDARPV